MAISREYLNFNPYAVAALIYIGLWFVVAIKDGIQKRTEPDSDEW